jgi:hypothetical protein
MVDTTNNFYGRHHTLETRLRLSEIAKNRKASDETKKHLSESHMGEKNHMFGKKHTEETKQKISDVKQGCAPTRLGAKHKEESIIKMSNVKLGNHYSAGHVVSEEAKSRISKLKNGKHMSLETRQKMSKSRIKQWQNPEYREHTVKTSHLAQNIHPNKPETIIGNMLDNLFPNNWKFVGDGSVVIEGYNPDFININGKKQIIEFFGDYWHGEKARTYQETEPGRIELFKKYGYNTLVIWGKELKHPETVMSKIREFCTQEVHQ